MMNFDFYNPTKIVFGKDRLNELDKHVPVDAKVLITYGGGSVKKFGTLEKVVNALGAREIIAFGDIEPNPQFNTLMKAVEIVKKEEIDFLLAVGGGSVMDGTKFIGVAANYEGDEAIKLLTEGKASKVKKCVPLGTVVTLPATGSESNPYGVISHEHGKYAMSNPGAFPVFSFLDPELTFTLPETQVANGVVDSFVHTLEQYLTYPVEGRFQDRTAEGILKTLIEIGRATIDNPTDYDLRANLVWNSTMALNGLIGAGVPQDWSTHMIGHELTAMFGLDHAKTLAVVLPANWIVRKDIKRDKLVQYAERVWNINEGSDDAKVEAAIDKTREFFESLGIKTRLTDYDIPKEKISDLVNALEKHGFTEFGEKGDINLEVSRKILEAAL